MNTTYYARSYATNSIGTAYGNEVTFAAWLNQAGATVLDIEGNSYSTVKIGDQVWMAENLKTSKYRNGEPISNVADNTQWTNIPIGDYSQGAYCNYSNNAANADTYGRLYNWYAVTNSRNICPQGWHVPSDAEWKKLEAYLGGWLVAGGKMKEIGATHWSNSNIGATNESGFTALPGGYRFSDATFNDISSKGYWWSSTELTTNPTTHALSRVLNSDNAKFSSFGYPKNSAFSVRCIKD